MSQLHARTSQTGLKKIGGSCTYLFNLILARQCVNEGMCRADGGKSVIVKYLTSSKLTRLQLRDAAFRRTLLLQCLVLLHACAHPIPKKAKPGGGGGPKQPVPVLKEKQARALLSALGEQVFTSGIGYWLMSIEYIYDTSCV